MSLWPTCKEVSTAVARGDYDDAGAWLRLRLLAHLAVCAGCRRFRRQLAVIAAYMKERAFPAPDPSRVAALEKAVLRRLS